MYSTAKQVRTQQIKFLTRFGKQFWCIKKNADVRKCRANAEQIGNRSLDPLARDAMLDGKKRLRRGEQERSSEGLASEWRGIGT
jgi:hypothetical protein